MSEEERNEILWVAAIVDVILSVVAALFDAIATELLGRRNPPGP